MKKLLMAAAMLLSVPANAAILHAPLPSNAYITLGGLDWAWAASLPATSLFFDLSFQSGLGWRLPTAAELLSAPNATDFIFAGANVPLGGGDPVSGAFFLFTNPALTGDAACAASYFSGLPTCDWSQGQGQGFGSWAGLPGAAVDAEQLVVRDALIGETPLPAALPLFAGGLGVIAFLARRRKPKAQNAA